MISSIFSSAFFTWVVPLLFCLPLSTVNVTRLQCGDPPLVQSASSEPSSTQETISFSRRHPLSPGRWRAFPLFREFLEPRPQLPCGGRDCSHTDNGNSPSFSPLPSDCLIRRAPALLPPSIPPGRGGSVPPTSRTRCEHVMQRFKVAPSGRSASRNSLMSSLLVPRAGVSESRYPK